MDNISIAFGHWLLATRTHQGISQSALEKQLSIGNKTIDRYEKGEASITVQYLEKILRALGKDFTDLFSENILGVNIYAPAITQQAGTLQDAPTLESLYDQLTSISPDATTSFYPRDMDNKTIEDIYCSGGALFAQDFSKYVHNARIEKGCPFYELVRKSKITHSALRRYERMFPSRFKVSSILALDHALDLNGILLAIAWRVVELHNKPGWNVVQEQTAEDLLKRHRMQIMQAKRTKQKQELAQVQGKTPPDSMDLFLSWIDTQLKTRNWTQHRLAKTAGLDTAAFRKARKKERKFSWEACAKIAAAFSLPPEYVFRKAGLLPDNNQIPDKVFTILSAMEEADQQRVLEYARSLSPMGQHR